MSVDEFALIDLIVAELGDRAQGDWVRLGPGDDGCVIEPVAGRQWVASVDTLIPDVHFPGAAPAELIGYRALMVSLSDLAAMGATPRYVLVALSLPQPDAQWVCALARGMAEAARTCDVYICGGNLAKGSLNITVSAHGDCDGARLLLRSGARPGDRVCVSGVLGGAAACVRTNQLNPGTRFIPGTRLTPVQERYFLPRARFDLIDKLADASAAAIDISDGLVADAGHLARASRVALHLDSTAVPVHPDARLQDALYGGDDYEILCTTPKPVAGLIPVGEVVQGSGVYLDGARVTQGGYQHF